MLIDSTNIFIIDKGIKYLSQRIHACIVYFTVGIGNCVSQIRFDYCMCICINAIAYNNNEYKYIYIFNIFPFIKR